MKLDILNINHLKNENIFDNLSVIIYSLIPIFLIIGTALSELAIFILSFKFLIDIIILKKIKLFQNNLIYYLLIIYAALLINLIFSVNIDNSFLRNIFFIKYIIFIIGTINFLSEKEERLFFILKIWTFIFIIFSFDLFFQFITHKNIIGLESPLIYHRLSGFMGDELKAGSLVLSFAMTIPCFLLVHTKMKNVGLFLLYLFLITVFITGDRSNFIKLFISIFFLLFFFKKEDLKKLFFFKILSIILIIFTISSNSIFNERYNQRIFNSFTVYNFNVFKLIQSTEYGKIYSTAYNLFLEKKIFGVGNKNFRIICDRDFQKKYPNVKNIKNIRCNTHPHQIYLEILSEHGIFGVIIMLFLLISFIYHNINYVIKKRNPLLGSLFIINLIFFIPLLPGGSFFTSFNATLFWLNFSLFYAYRNICNKNNY